MDHAEAPVDVERLTRPEAEAFRLIAAALGARFAGDPAHPPEASAAVASIPDMSVADPRAAGLLDRMPVPVVVVNGDAIAFLNRAAHLALGYPSAAALDAAGGLGALFLRGDVASDPGTRMIAAANGAAFAARVTITAVAWGDGRAMLVTLEPRYAPPERSGGAAGDLLVRLIDANPDPVAIVDRAGAVEACNSAFMRLASGEHSGRLAARLAPCDLRPVLDAVDHAFCLAEGLAEAPAPVTAAGTTYRVTVGALPGGHLACLVLHVAEPPMRPSMTVLPPPDPRGALERAVDDVRRLVDEAAVLVILEGAPLADGGEPAVRFWRSLILSVAARAEVGSVLAVRHREGKTTLRLAPRAAQPFDRVITSVRIADLAAAAALQIGMEADALAVRATRSEFTPGIHRDNLR